MKLVEYRSAAALACSVLALGCAPVPPVAQVAEQGILARSSPAHGSVVTGPLSKIELWFDPPARLIEVSVSGPEGMMPMMVTAVGEVGYYSLPVSAEAPGAYTVNWRATAAGSEHSGAFAFQLR